MSEHAREEDVASGLSWPGSPDCGDEEDANDNKKEQQHDADDGDDRNFFLVKDLLMAGLNRVAAGFEFREN